MNKVVQSKIKQRRQQMLVHSILYYEFDSPIITDKQYDIWARELVELQKNHPKESKSTLLFDVFSDWDGNTGFDIYQNQYKYYNIARELLAYHRSESIRV